MKTFYEFLNEMAAPRAGDMSKKYYHGTDTEQKALAIIRNGLDPAATELKYGSKKPTLRPQANHVYITPDIRYAMIYAIGGDVAGSDYSLRDIPSRGEFCFVFEIDNKSLVDIGPDEDSIGELICHWYRGDRKIGYNIVAKAEKYATQKQLRDLKDGFYEAWAAVGKKVTKYLSDEEKLSLIDAGAHIAHNGRLKVKKVYRLSRNDVPKLKRDGSNFFKYAKVWKP